MSGPKELSIYSTNDDIYGFVLKESGVDALPKEKQWKFEKDITVSNDEEKRIGFDAKKALDDIETKGFHLSQVKVKTNIIE